MYVNAHGVVGMNLGLKFQLYQGHSEMLLDVYMPLLALPDSSELKGPSNCYVSNFLVVPKKPLSLACLYGFIVFKRRLLCYSACSTRSL
jgi:hypothetical protein